MDNLTHSLVGLASAKAGLERLSPYATPVCLVSANIADADFVTLFFGDRWTLLQHHRGITHSIVGTLAIGFLVPLVAVAIERLIVKARKTTACIRFPGLLIASLITAATHPFLDWTNNYGLRPFLPWSGRWFYGDLVFIVDPYIWLLLGGVCFLLTSKTRSQMRSWAILGSGIATLIGFAAWQSGADAGPLRVVFVIWILVMLVLAILRASGSHKYVKRSAVITALLLLVVYWGVLAFAHRSALADTFLVANRVAATGGESLVRVAAMPTVATPFEWQSVAETDLAMYRFTVEVGNDKNGASKSVAWRRYEKPTGQISQLVSSAERDRRAQILFGFARFPIGRVNADNCVGQALVQFADLRYTEPGASRGNFSVNVPVDCPAR